MTYRDEAKASKAGKVSRVLNGANKSNSDAVMASEGARGTSPVTRKVDSQKVAGKKSSARFDRPARARGGSVKKGKTNVTVIVAPQGGAGGAPGVSVAGGPPTMMPPSSAPPMGGPPPAGAGGPPMAPPRPPMAPPHGMPMRARGGSVARAKGGPCWDGYSASGTKTKGGRTVPDCKPNRKSGGKVMAGGGSGMGRLEKSGLA